MIGLKKDELLLVKNQDYKKYANDFISMIDDCSTGLIKAVEHIGSTALDISSKPIIDLALLYEVGLLEQLVRELGHIGFSDLKQCNNWYLMKLICDGKTVCHLHLFALFSDYIKHITFRDFLSEHSQFKQAYQNLKLSLVAKGLSRSDYTKAKNEFCSNIHRMAIIDKFLGTEVEYVIDRERGSQHPEGHFTYPIDYGYIENVYALDGSEQDCYIIDRSFSNKGFVCAVVLRFDDNEDKLIIGDNNLDIAKVLDAVKFTEQYFDSLVLMANEKFLFTLPFFPSIIRFERLCRGWSFDNKYICSFGDRKALLRVVEYGKSAQQKEIFELLRKEEMLSLPCQRAIEIGVTMDKSYLLHNWIEGVSLEDVIGTLPLAKQYDLGFEAGLILRRIHSISVNVDIDWETKYKAKIAKKIATAKRYVLKYPFLDSIISFVLRTQDVLNNRPISYHHGDYHIGNFIYHEGISIIDFDRLDYGDPYEEFNRIVWSVEKSPVFAKGQIDGYFNGDIPKDFFKLMSLYISTNALGSISWAEESFPEQIPVIVNQIREILHYYNDFTEEIPLWYTKEN